MPKKSEYGHMTDGESFILDGRVLKIQCCECSLVHVWNLRVIKQGRKTKIKFTVNRDEQATAACRKGRKRVRLVPINR